MQPTQGQLFIVATPIGNLKDISERALETLRSVDTILAEDCRVSAKLLAAYGINTPMQSFHAHNEQAQLATIQTLLEQGKQLALISDAGTPLISDPGQSLIAALRQTGIPVTPIPGSCALIAALCASGLASTRFIFEGFLPVKAGARLKRLQALINDPRTLIFYDAPHRIVDALQACLEALGAERKMVVAREITKLYETFILGNIEECLQAVTENPDNQRGEFVIIIEGNDEPQPDTQPTVNVDALLKTLLPHVSTKQAATQVAELTGLKKNDLYQRALNLNIK